MNNRKEKFIEKKFRNYTGICPECREMGKTTVLPFGDDEYFCENPKCEVTRHSNIGYYKLTNEDIKLNQVNYVQKDMVQKRK